MTRAEKNIEHLWQEKEDLAIQLIKQKDKIELLENQIDKIKERIRKIGIVNDALGVLEKQINDAIQKQERNQEKTDNSTT